MPICPNCLYEYLPGVKICPDCGAELVDQLEQTDWVVVYTSDKEYEIQMLKDSLESADIRVNVLSQKDSNFPVTGDLAIIRLLVKKEDEQAALSYINSLDNFQPDTEEESV